VPIFRLLPLSLAYGSGLHGPVLKEPQWGNIGKQIESTSNCKSPLVWPQNSNRHAAAFNFPDYSNLLEGRCLELHTLAAKEWNGSIRTTTSQQQSVLIRGPRYWVDCKKNCKHYDCYAYMQWLVNFVHNCRHAHSLQLSNKANKVSFIFRKCFFEVTFQVR